MLSSTTLVFLATLAALIAPSAQAATADQWRSRSIYQLITDRFAPPSDTAPARTSPLPSSCDPMLQTWCGGTWLSIIDKLDYIQGMGFDAIWISPTSQNIDIYTPYKYAYHGYWVNDPMSINQRFGSADDLKALSKAVHSRGMYLMVDVVIQNVPSLNVQDALHPENLAADNSRWQKPEYFHPQCWIDYSNQTSVENCWLGDDKLALMDVNTENAEIQQALQNWISDYVKEYGIDGLRIDAAKHVPGAFWTPFCAKAGVFCIGEVYGDDMGFAVKWQTQKWLDSILGFPLYYGIKAGFGTPMGNMSHFVDIAQQVVSSFPDPGVLGNFIENHDLPRWRNTTVDPQLAYNAMIVQFLFDGIPVTYYGQEQDFADGAADPYNRQALWPSKYQNTTTYTRMGRLNRLRQAMIANNTLFEGKNYLNSSTKILTSTQYDVAMRKGPMVAILTNRGSPSVNATFGVVKSGFQSQSPVIDALTCKQFIVGTDGSISISYSAPGAGGMPYVFLSMADMAALKLCTSDGKWSTVNSTVSALDPTSSSGTTSSSTAKSGEARRIPLNLVSGVGLGLVGLVVGLFAMV